MSVLLTATDKSYQNIDNLLIECPICLEEKKINECIMPDCKHSWCNSCNEEMNKFNIINCPICKKKFINLPLKNGTWEYKSNGEIFWRKGTEDTKYTIRKKKLWQFYYNTFCNIPFQGNTISGISV